MLTFNQHNRTAWSDYFPGTNPTATLSSQEYTTTKTISGTYVYISNCLFSKCSSSSYGGALSCTSATYFLAESSSFFSCKTSAKYGGAIFSSNSNSGQCVLHKVCGNDCYSTSTSSSYGQFARMHLSNVAESKNCVNYSSIVRCVIGNSNSNYNLYLYYGKI